jgi:hypothetical protein
MYEVAGMCLGFCRELDAIGDMFLWLLCGACGLAECTRGDASYETYRMGTELNSAIVAMGFHEELKPNGRIPFSSSRCVKRFEQ